MNPKSGDQNPQKYEWQIEKGKLLNSRLKIQPLAFFILPGNGVKYVFSSLSSTTLEKE
jgi:hypothetical protein